MDDTRFAQKILRILRAFAVQYSIKFIHYSRCDTHYVTRTIRTIFFILSGCRIFGFRIITDASLTQFPRIGLPEAPRSAGGASLFIPTPAIYSRLSE